MHLADFALERYLGRWEFQAKHLLCASDIEPLAMHELLSWADGECAEMWRSLRLGYTEAAGHPRLRAEVAQLYERISAEQIHMFAGAEEAIFATINVLVQPGDHVIVTWPAYQSLYEVARARGAEVTLHRLNPPDWAIDVDELRAQLRPNTRLIVMNAPHNPTGGLPDRGAFDRIVRLAREANAHLLSDEVYRFLEADPADRLPAAADVYERAVSIGVMSKSFALAGLRVGWIAARDEALLRRVAAFKDYTTICNSAPSEVLSLIALRAKDRILERSRSILAGNLSELDRFFSRWEKIFSWRRPRGGSVAFPELLAAEPIDQFTAQLVEQTGVLLLPATVYDYPGNRFRIGFGRQNLREALGHLETFTQRQFGSAG